MNDSSFRAANPIILSPLSFKRVLLIVKQMQRTGTQSFSSCAGFSHGWHEECVEKHARIV